MLVRHLSYFVTPAREKHFARAAELSNVAQPTLSAAIRKLEDGGHAGEGVAVEIRDGGAIGVTGPQRFLTGAGKAANLVRREIERAQLMGAALGEHQHAADLDDVPGRGEGREATRRLAQFAARDFLPAGPA